MKELVLKNEELDIVMSLILNELEYYSMKEDFDECDEEYRRELRKLLEKVEELR